MGVDLVAVAVDYHMVVVPAQRGEVVGIVGSALGCGGDVVGLEPVAALAAVGGAGTLVPVEDEPFEFGWDGAAGGSDREGCAVGAGGEDFDRPVAEDLFEG